MLIQASLVPLLLSASALALPTHQDVDFDDCDQDWSDEVSPAPSGQAFGAQPSGHAFGSQPFGVQPSSAGAAPVQVQPSSVAPVNIQPSTSTSTSTSTSSSSTQSAVAAPTTAAAATVQHEASTTTSSNTQASTDLCGDYDYIILEDTPWIVYNMLYNADEIVGSQCTNYGEVTATSNGTQEVVWSSVTDIEYVESTNNVPKGYSFVGLTENLETRLSAIDSIPAEYVWSRTNTTAFKGNICFDFMTNDIKGDSTSTSSHELMLWLQYEGGQLPIGWTNGVVDTIDDLFGTSWKLYQEANADTGITVSSLLPETQFEGTFDGDLKEWLEALVKVGIFDADTYVNVGNAGTEFFYGNAVMNSTLGLQINLS
ncbi:concanavalin A-like lectin/glucanase [Aspergillus heteromorphus CBS 117.55]|uniref:xyloglucan-specific endo-beta-1,4-glucanase n=1 Tax=Aspergillus heteromorphus CBS 117.55 TaxID=1448321 RepID=A0A317VY29_9EURO|nr:concanavalin A-like lectin/glucanase [Aspergillus heteromorphus CBS 117.55]PWY79193.1 concanavalin A-like lectin/glucanase [Aspergillus heteromorphus CBS 117.55]